MCYEVWGPIGGLRLGTVGVDWMVETGLRMGHKEGENKNKLGLRHTMEGAVHLKCRGT